MKLRSIIFGHSGVVIDSCPKCHGVWLDRGEYDAIIHFLHEAATNSTTKEISQELRDDLKKIVSGEGPEGRLAELGDATAAIEALANTVIFDHPGLFNLLNRTSSAGGTIGMS